jgi:predicted porin
MQRKLLLCSTALVSAGLLMSAIGLAQETEVEETEVEETEVEETEVEEAEVGETEDEETDVDETEGDETEVDEAEVDEAEDEEAEVDETEVDEAEDEEAEGDETEVDEAEDEETEGEEAQGDEAEDEEAEGDEAEDEERVVEAGGFEVVLGGTTEFGVQAGSKNTITGENDRSYTFFMDNELFIEAIGATESGILFGSRIVLEVGTGGLDGDPPTTEIDDASLFFSGNFGRLELGRRDGAEDLMYVGAEEAQAGTGGIDGDIPNLNFVQFTTTDTAAKVTYFTPRGAGLQLGVSFTPDYDDDRDNRFQGGDAEGEDGVGAGINWVGVLGPVDLTLSAVGIWAKCESGCDNDSDDGEGFDDEQRSWAIGGLLGFGDFTFGAGYHRQDDFAPETRDNDIVNLGLSYGLDEANLSVGYTFNKFGDDDLDASHLFVVSGDLRLLPGVTLLADIGYNTNDLEATRNGVIEQDDTIGGVVSIELEY